MDPLTAVWCDCEEEVATGPSLRHAVPDSTEAQLASALAEGCTMSEFAQRRGCTEQTARTHLLCNQVVGHFDQALADEIMSRGNTLLAKHGQLAVFSDWFQMASYEPSCRRSMTEWGVGLGKGLTCFHVIAGTRLVKMGLAVASIVVPTLRAHDRMTSFVAAYRDARRGR